jgi:hypothetical protein
MSAQHDERVRSLWATDRSVEHELPHSHESTPEIATAGPDDHRVACPMEDDAETSTTSWGASSDKALDRKGTIAMLVAVAFTVFGVKLITISALGSRIPLLDQWDGEAQRLYAPYLGGHLSFTDLFAPHNEHRIFFTRVLALLHLELAGEWNTILEMILCAIVHTALITWLAALLMPLVPPRRRLLLACFVAFLFVFPIGYENLLLGFNFHFYLTLFFGIASLVAFSAARPFSLRWFGGLVAAVLSYLSFSSGIATILAAAILVGLQLGTKARSRCFRELAAVGVMLASAVGMVVWAASISPPKTSWWPFFQGIVLYTSINLLAVVPIAWFCRHTLARRPVISDRGWVAVGIALWTGIQIALLAYGRGPLIAPRYMDTVLLLYPVGLVAIVALSDKWRSTRSSRFARIGAASWLVVVLAGIALLGSASVLAAVEWKASARQQESNLQAYLATGSVDRLNGMGAGVHGIDLAYPYPHRLANILRDPNVRAILPSEFRPADADNAAARNSMWLKGAAASTTAAAVPLILLIGPVLLGVGLALFIAAAARLALPLGAGRRWGASAQRGNVGLRPA